MTRDQIIQAIEAHAKANGIAPATVTSRAVGNSRLYQRLKDGGDCTTEVVARLQAYMSEKFRADECLPKPPAPGGDSSQEDAA